MAKKQLEIQDTDTPMSRLCDKLLESRDAMVSSRSAYQAVEKEVIQTMRKDGKKSIKHGGVTIRQIHKEEKDLIQIVSAD